MGKFSNFLARNLEFIPMVKRVSNDKATMYETFIQQQYRWLTTGNRLSTTAVDIGANIGDSAIYLAMNDKVKKVYAYEPFPILYHRAVNNIRASPFGKKIKIYNYGVSNKREIIQIPEGYGANVYSSLKDFSKGKKIRIVDLNQVLHGMRNVIIKCDCEGSEHQIFNRDVSLKNVYRCQIEWHQDYEDICKILDREGFTTRVKIEGDRRIGRYGWIYAWKTRAS